MLHTTGTHEVNELQCKVQGVKGHLIMHMKDAAGWCGELACSIVLTLSAGLANKIARTPVVLDATIRWYSLGFVRSSTFAGACVVPYIMRLGL